MKRSIILLIALIPSFFHSFIPSSFFSAVCAETTTVRINSLWYTIDTDQLVAEVVQQPANGKPIRRKEGKLTIPKTVKYENQTYTVIGVGRIAFEKWDKVTEIVLSDQLQYIDQGAFAACTSLQKVTIPENLRAIGSGAFALCKNLQSVHWKAVDCHTLYYEDPRQGVTQADQAYVSPFQNCPKLTSITFGKKVETIPEFMLNIGKNHIKEITLPETLKTIGDRAFFGLQIKQITIPASVIEIGEYAFANCAKLKHVLFQSPLWTKAGKETWFAGTGATIESILMPGESVHIEQ